MNRRRFLSSLFALPVIAVVPLLEPKRNAALVPDNHVGFGGVLYSYKSDLEWAVRLDKVDHEAALRSAESHMALAC